MQSAGKIYFASDFHLGAPDHASSLIREKKVVAWLDSIKHDVRELYLMGDLFDFWYEYRYTVPKGYTRLLGKLAEIADKGVPIHLFTGNHDLWIKDYLVQEIGIKIERKPIIREIDGKTFYLAHGDGLGPGDTGFKLMKKVFENRFSQWLYSRIHPNTAIAMANYFSRRSRASTGKHDAVFHGEDKEWLILHSRDMLKERHIDYFIYGHRHLPLYLPLQDGSTYVNLGDWIRYFTYAEWNGTALELKYYS